MAREPEATVITDEIVFELERFDRSDGRLTLSGRWFGVRGRRFVRPTLTLAGEGDRTRALADLEDKPWAAEDGEPWRASFPWDRGERIQEPELSVAPDITIHLPAPGKKHGRKRLAAQPRREAMNASWSAGSVGVEAEPPRAGAAEPEPEPAPPDANALQAEIADLQAQLAEAETQVVSAEDELGMVRDDLVAVRARFEGAQHELRERADVLQAIQAELGEARNAREVALRSAAQAEAEREEALTRAAETDAERDALRAEKADLTAALEESRSSLAQLSRQHDELASARGAALVMREATQAMPAYERHVGWLRRGLAVLVLLGIVFAVLIVLGAL